MTRQLILGAVFRALGAFPSGWRYPGAHNDPLRDPAVLRRTARAAEAAKFDYLFFGEWLATGPDLEFRDPDLLARMDPLSAISYLAGVTRRIGLIATANTGYYDLFTLARQTASIDRLSGGRAGINLVTGADPRAAANHGRDPLGGAEPRYDEADEYVRALRMLWDSWEDDAFLRDRASGRLIDPERLLRRTYTIRDVDPAAGRLSIDFVVHGEESPGSRFAVRARPGDRLRERIAALLTMQSRARALHQFMTLLVGEAEVEGIALEGADSPLVQ